MKKIFTLLCTLAFAGTMSAQSWVNYAADSYAGGTGTYDDPYLISTPEQLAKVAKDCDNGDDFFDAMNLDCVYFKMTNDIDLAGKQWEPIGGCYKAGQYFGGNAIFKGSFDGDGHSIMNMNISTGDFLISGFINHLGDYGELKNLTIASGKVNGFAAVAALVGHSSGLVENCVNYADVYASNVLQAGGLCSHVGATDSGEPARFIKCINYGNVVMGTSGNNMCAGGIVAKIEKGATCYISECANFGDVTTAQYAGGIIGQSEGGAVVNNCYNRGTINAGVNCAAGALGFSYNDLERIHIRNFYNAAEIKSSGLTAAVVANAGGLKLTTADSIYNDKSLYVGDLFPSVVCPDATVYGNYTTDEMTSEDFVAQLNSFGQEPNAWAMDTEGINDGYPVFVYQNPSAPSAIETVEGNDVKVYANNGKIFVEGAEGTVSVYAITGNLLFAGSAEALNNVSLEMGVYIVAVDGVSRKVVVD